MSCLKSDSQIIERHGIGASVAASGSCRQCVHPRGLGSADSPASTPPSQARSWISSATSGPYGPPTSGSMRIRSSGILAVIEFAWSLAVMLLEKSDLQSWTSAPDSTAHDVDRRLLRIAAERSNVDSRDHRQLHADRPKRSRAWRAIPEERSLYPGPQHRRIAARRRKHIRVFHEHGHFVGASVHGSSDCCVLHPQSRSTSSSRWSRLSRGVSRLHFSRLWW